MQRIALALIAVAILVAALAALLTAFRRVMGTDGANLPAVARGTALQKTAFALLAALSVYVAFWGPG